MQTRAVAKRPAPNPDTNTEYTMQRSLFFSLPSSQPRRLTPTALLVVLLLSGCSPLYVMRAAYEQGKILANRQDIHAAIESPATPASDREKLQLVLEAREFAIQMGLTPGASFTKYTRVDKDVLAWVLVASKPDAFALHTWWFPIVGRVPYKGFFDKAEADAAALVLEKRGYESSVRGTEAMSTLGWFNDPVLSTTLRHEPPRVVNTVIHETLHATVWIPNHVDFNESLANFVGGKGMAQFYAAKRSACQGECAAVTTAAALACRSLQGDLHLAAAVETLYDDLNTLYTSPRTREDKIQLRTEIFARHTAALRTRFTSLRALQTVNNAELIQLKLYMTKLMQFEALYRTLDRSWERFLGVMREIAAAIKQDGTRDPYELLLQRVADTAAGAAPITEQVCE